MYLFREDNTCSFISPKRDENCELCETDTCTCNFQGQNIQALSPINPTLRPRRGRRKRVKPANRALVKLDRPITCQVDTQ